MAILGALVEDGSKKKPAGNKPTEWQAPKTGKDHGPDGHPGFRNDSNVFMPGS